MTNRCTSRQWRANRVAVWLHHGGRCVACGIDTHLDECQARCPTCYQCGHRVASYWGGSDHPANLVALCRNCNRSMGNNNLDDYLAGRTTTPRPPAQATARGWCNQVEHEATAPTATPTTGWGNQQNIKRGVDFQCQPQS